MRRFYPLGTGWVFHQVSMKVVREHLRACCEGGLRFDFQGTKICAQKSRLLPCGLAALVPPKHCEYWDSKLAGLSCFCWRVLSERKNGRAAYTLRDLEHDWNDVFLRGHQGHSDSQPSSQWGFATDQLFAKRSGPGPFKANNKRDKNEQVKAG